MTRSSSVPPLKLASMLLLTTSMLLVPRASAVDADLVEYARLCAAAMNDVPIPDFDCRTGVEISMTGTEGADCTEPPYLPGAGCYRYSRIGDLGSTADVGMLFLCRHKETATPTSNEWNDIAVIQTHYESGATCFFQQLDHNGELDGNVRSPASGDEAWFTPKTMALPANACVQCHDNGPFLRTPYVAQVADQIPALVGFADRNKSRELRRRYWFPGARFLFWKTGHNWNGSVYRVSVNEGKACLLCHEMGTTDIDMDVGTSTWLGLYSTGAVATPYLEGGAGPDGDLAYWMRPRLTAPSASSQDASRALDDCARHDAGTDCERVLFEGQVTALTDLALEALAALPAPQEYGVRGEERATRAER